MLRFFRLGFSRCASLYITDTIFKFFYVFIVASNYFCIFSRLNEVHKKVVWINKTRLNYILSARGYASHLEWTIWNENELGWLFSHYYNLRASNIFLIDNLYFKAVHREMVEKNELNPILFYYFLLFLAHHEYIRTWSAMMSEEKNYV